MVTISESCEYRQFIIVQQEKLITCQGKRYQTVRDRSKGIGKGKGSMCSAMFCFVFSVCVREGEGSSGLINVRYILDRKAFEKKDQWAYWK